MTTAPTDLPDTERGHPLDNVVWSSLSGPHASFAEGGPKARRYPPAVSPWMGIADPDDGASWADLAQLAGPGETVLMSGPPGLRQHLPAGWEVEMDLPGIQLVATEALAATPDPDAVRLGPDDVEEMLDLVARTQPGPFSARTHELGAYLGIRRDGALVAMAGERLHPAGWTEISAVCTDPAFRGQGLAGRLVRAVGHEIRQRQEVPFLHAAESNAPAVRLYESIGFARRRSVGFFLFRAPHPKP